MTSSPPDSPLELVSSDEIQLLVSLLHEAEEGDERIIHAIEDPSTEAYIARSAHDTVGAVVMRWLPDEGEIIYIATRPEVRGKGYGKAILRAIVDEARRRGVEAVCVGTANSSWSNIAFYQKCGFRMDSVRKDFFNYLPSLVYEDGIQIQDMLMLRLSLADD